MGKLALVVILVCVAALLAVAVYIVAL